MGNHSSPYQKISESLKSGNDTHLDSCSEEQTLIGFMLTVRDRIKRTSSVDVSSSAFEYLFHQEEGAAISISSQSTVKLNLKKCLFLLCYTEKMGGAIYCSASKTTFSVSKSCFESCSIIIRGNEVYGNALHIRSTSSKIGSAQINQTMHYFCGPWEKISADSTVYFLYTKLEATAPNFTRCHNDVGSCTVAIDQNSAKVINMQQNDGKSLHISFIDGSGKLEIQKSNMINWTQSSSDQIFWVKSGKTEVKDCAIFPAFTYSNFGTCTFLGKCYGNFTYKNITYTKFTQFMVPEVSFGVYCRAYGGKDEMYENVGQKEFTFIRNLIVGLLLPQQTLTL